MQRELKSLAQMLIPKKRVLLILTSLLLGGLLNGMLFQIPNQKQSLVYATCIPDIFCCSEQIGVWKDCDFKMLMNGKCPIPPTTRDFATKRLYDYQNSWDADKKSFSHPQLAQDAWKNQRTPPDWYGTHKDVEAAWNALQTNLRLYEVGGGARANIGSAMRSWCWWVQEVGGKYMAAGVTDWLGHRECYCGIPQPWWCYEKVKIRINGWHWWYQSPPECGSAPRLGLPTPWPATCSSSGGTQFAVPPFTLEHGGLYTLTHEFGHAAGLTHTAEPNPSRCVPDLTIMHSHDGMCLMGHPCTGIKPSVFDEYAIRFLYGPE